MAKLLDGYQPEEDFCRENGPMSRRTCARYRNERDGLPYVLWAGKVYIHIEGARAWLVRRTVSRNPSRRAA
jgi:hypothetical protein